MSDPARPLEPPYLVEESREGYRIQVWVPGGSDASLGAEILPDRLRVGGSGLGKRWERCFALPKDADVGRMVTHPVEGGLEIKLPTRARKRPDKTAELS